MTVSRAARLQFVAAALRSAVQFGFQWLLARGFGAAAFGVCNTAQAGLQTASILGKAAGDTVVLRQDIEGEETRSPVLGAGVLLSLVGGALAGLALLAWGLLRTSGEAPFAYALAALAVPLATSLFPLGAQLQRQRRFPVYTLLMTTLEPTLRMALLVGIVVAGGHWLWAMATFPLAAALVLALGVAFTGAYLPRFARALDPIRLHTLRFSAVTTIGYALQSAMYFTAMAVTEATSGSAEAGVLAAALRLVMLAQWIQAAFAAPFLPQVPRLLGRDAGRAELLGLYRRVVVSVLWVNAPFLAALAVASPAVLGLFGEEFTSGWPALVVLVAAQWVNSATALAEDLLPLGARAGLALVNNLLALAATAVFGTLFGDRWGAMGVACAFAIAVILLNVVRAVQVRRLFGVTLPLGTILRVGALSVTAVLLALAVSGDTPAWRAVAGAVAGVGLFVAMVATAGPGERAALAALMRGRD